MDPMCRESSLVKFMDPVCRLSDIGRSAGLEFDPMVWQSSYGIPEIDPFGIPGFYGIVTYFRWWEGDVPLGMLTYIYWPMTPFMDFLLCLSHTLSKIVK